MAINNILVLRHNVSGSEWLDIYEGSVNIVNHHEKKRE
jgi:hypothetical protein